jgi:hypothetical protein
MTLRAAIDLTLLLGFIEEQEEQEEERTEEKIINEGTVLGFFSESRHLD